MIQPTICSALARRVGYLIPLLLLAACATATPTDSTSRPVPTVAPIFSDQRATPIPRPTLSPVKPLPTPDPVTRTDWGEELIEVPLFGDQLSSGWSLQHSQGMRFGTNSIFVYDSRFSLEALPLAGEGKLYLTLDPDTGATYLRDQVVGVSFWLSGGDRPVANDDFAVTVVGSDAYSHWVAGDTSVQIVGRDVTPEEPLFSETRLYYLGVSRDIPANTWVEVTLWLDEREVDPDYRYVTGIYIKNSMYYQSTYYVDRVSLLLRRPGGS